MITTKKGLIKALKAERLAVKKGEMAPRRKRTDDERCFELMTYARLISFLKKNEVSIGALRKQGCFSSYRPTSTKFGPGYGMLTHRLMFEFIAPK